MNTCNVNGTFLSSREHADGINNISWQAQQNHQPQNEQAQGGSQDLSALLGLGISEIINNITGNLFL